jgi:hypothetical protein
MTLPHEHRWTTAPTSLVEHIPPAAPRSAATGVPYSSILHAYYFAEQAACAVFTVMARNPIHAIVGLALSYVQAVYE